MKQDGDIMNSVKALRGIRESLIDTKKYLRSWGLGDPCTSNWTGVLCFNTTLNDGYLHVRELQLLNMNLSGTLSPELGRLSYMEILDVLWNNISGSLPKEIGNITSLELLLVSGNQLTGSLPEEIGYLPNLERIQIDENQISGPIPKSFANLNKTRHFHMNNNSLSGQIPPELHILPNLFHLLLDNNNLSGHLPPELSESPKLLILQLDNNNFEGSMIPPSYGNMSHLLKMSLRNCSLQGPMPDLSGMHALGYIDLSSNQLNGSIPAVTLSQNITTIDLSNNQLTGAIPSSFSGLPHLQKLSLLNNTLNGSVPSTIWQNRTFNIRETLILDFQNNNLTNISGNLNLPPNVTLSLQGNPICSNGDADQFCGTPSAYGNDLQSSPDLNATCPAQACPPPYQYAPASLEPCFCAAPLLVGYRLKSPGFSGFDPYIYRFEDYLTSGLRINLHQLDFTYQWQKGPRLRMYLKIFPVYVDNSSYIFNKSEVVRIRSMFTGWLIPYNYFFGPYELLNFTLLDPYKEDFPTPSSSGLSKGAVAGIVIGAIAGAITVYVLISLIILRSLPGKYHPVSRRRRASRVIKIDGVKSFSFEEMKRATNNFDRASEVGQGGYGKVYKGILADGAAVAIKRAQEGSLQGEKEFLTEIELLSRLHHRNLVSLLGFCEEEGEQMLVYEFMSNGTLRDHLSGAKYKESLSFAMRVKIALASAKGILYLHTEADPPIFHRDIKATNILLDSSFIAKVADFGLSRLAPVPDIEGIVPGHVSTVVKGTPGYLDPEYFLTHKLTDKSDVYSLGVVLLEILTGMYPITHGKNIVREVNMSYSSGMICSLIDEKIGSYPSDSVEKFVTLALKCCREETDERPSMAEVVRELENIWHMLPESDSRTTDSSDSNVGKAKDMSTQSPSYVSDISGSDLVSEVVPTISPR